MITIKNVLLLNSVFSAISGSTMLLFTEAFKAFFQLPHPYIFPIIGLNLLVFAGFVAFVAYRRLDKTIWVQVISVLDALWVLGSIIIVGFQLFNLPVNAYLLITAVAIWIGILAYKQFKLNRI
jgi:hypothetical protein